MGASVYTAHRVFVVEEPLLEQEHLVVQQLLSVHVLDEDVEGLAPPGLGFGLGRVKG